MVSNSSPSHLPVLIVGAGPSGLSLAASLTKLEIPVRIIERKPGLSETSKATNLMQGTQEKLDIFGLAEPMVSLSGKMSRMVMEAYGAQLGARTMHLEESPFPDVLLLGQDNIEKSLAYSLDRLGKEIEFNTSLIHLTQDQEIVKVVLQKNKESFDALDLDFKEEKDYHAGDKPVITWEEYFSYVIACDGPWGITRSFTQCDFKPLKTGRSIRQVDARLKWKRLGSLKQMWLFYFPAGFMVVVPLLEGYYRILSIEPTESIPDRKPTLIEMQNKLRDISRDQTVELVDPKWFSYTELTMGIAPKLIDHRVILVGDAGNPILPNGGQGLNTGIQDSLNLAWKLAFVWKGEGKSRLLETYQEERWPLRQALEKVQFNSLKYTTKPPRIMQWVLSKFGNSLLNMGELAMAKAFSQLGVDYKKSSLSHKGKFKGPIGGDRILDADVREASTGMDKSIFKELSFPEWKILIFDANQKKETKDFSFLARLKIPRIKLLFINANLEIRHKEYEEMGISVFFDIDLLAHKVYGIRKPSLLLIRPDNYISLRTEKLDGSEILDFQEIWYNK